MKMNEEQCMKFPVVLREKFIAGEIELPDTAEFTFEKIYAYRAVERTEDDTSMITRDELMQYAIGDLGIAVLAYLELRIIPDWLCCDMAAKKDYGGN